MQTSAPPNPAAEPAVASLDRYNRHLRAAAVWLEQSIAKGKGGSCAHFGPRGWSRPYPETTGYIIPTLLQLSEYLNVDRYRELADQLGRWLLSIQLECGAWQGGLYPARSPQPSVFNTGQILKGLAALYRHTHDNRWLTAATRGALWIANGITSDRLWEHQDYRSSATPTYYTHVAWPLLEVWSLNDDAQVRTAAETVLQVLAGRREEDGGFTGWEFAIGKPAFTHTIAYTVRGFQESARLLDAWEPYGEITVDALARLLRQAELSGGRLPGAYDRGWKPVKDYSCLTGNVQIALSLLIWESREPDLRIVNAAAKLVDFVCNCQSLRSPIAGIRGAVAGSVPLWRDYMRFRYPNWAAKYHCDALMRLSDRLHSEYEVDACESS